MANLAPQMPTNPPRPSARRGSFPRLARVLSQEFTHEAGDLVPVLLQGEVAGVEQVKFQVVEIPLVGMGPFGRENLVVLAPDDQRRRLVLAEIRLPLRIQGRVAAVAEE